MRHFIIANDNDCGLAQRNAIAISDFIFFAICHFDQKRNALINRCLNLVPPLNCIFRS